MHRFESFLTFQTGISQDIKELHGGKVMGCGGFRPIMIIRVWNNA